MNGSKALILASASPRRQEILRNLGLSFDVNPQDIDESINPDEPPELYVRRMAENKAQSCLASLQGHQSFIILGADTVVVLENDILGKPRDPEHAADMLGRLGGKEHKVMTAVAVTNGERQECSTAMASVTFRSLNKAEIEAYIRSGEPLDKAGAYGIQGLGGMLVSHLAGSYSAVVGLPILETAELLQKFGIPMSELLAGARA